MKKFKQFYEEFTFKVDVEGLPDMFMKGNSPGEVKSHLRKLVKQPSMVKSVDRATKYDVRKTRKSQMQMGESSVDETPKKKFVQDPKLKNLKMLNPRIKRLPVDFAKGKSMDENRRDRLRAKLAAVGKDMEKTNNDLKKTMGIEDKPKQRLGHDGKPYKSKFYKDEQSAPKKGAQPKKQGFMARLKTGGLGAAIMGTGSKKSSIANKIGMY